MELPVVDHRDPRLLQQLCHPGTDGDHIVILIQGPVFGAFPVVLSLFGIALRGMGMQDQHLRLRAGQIPGQGLLQQRFQIRPGGAGIENIRQIPQVRRENRQFRHTFRRAFRRPGRRDGQFLSLRRFLHRRRKPDPSSGFQIENEFLRPGPAEPVRHRLKRPGEPQPGQQGTGDQRRAEAQRLSLLIHRSLPSVYARLPTAPSAWQRTAPPAPAGRRACPAGGSSAGRRRRSGSEAFFPVPAPPEGPGHR